MPFAPIPPPVEELVARLLAKSPEQRPPNAAALLAADVTEGTGETAANIKVEGGKSIGELLTESIAYGLDHRQEAMDYAMRHARGLEDDPVRSDRFVGMYVNDWTRDYGAVGRRAVQRLLDRGHDAGILPQRVIAEWVESD